jgi:chitin synthase
MQSLREAISPQPPSSSRRRTSTKPSRTGNARASPTEPPAEVLDVYGELSRRVNSLLGQQDRPPSGGPPQSNFEIDSLPYISQPLYRTEEAMAIQRYRPGQVLAPIHTGETLQLSHDNEPSQLTLSSTHLVSPMDISNESAHDQEDDIPPQTDRLIPSDHISSRPLDHFDYDTEAFASGLSSRCVYKNARSRSPTPAIDGEDYCAMDLDSIHHTHSSQEDPEKVDLSARRTSWISTIDPSAPLFDEKSDISYYSMPTAPSIGETRHFGPAPLGRVTRRHRSMKRMKVTTEKVELVNGCLVLDIPVAPGLMLPRKGVPEMMHTRYTGVICDPDDYEKTGLFLRQNAYGRRTEMFIVITMYNVCASWHFDGAHNDQRRFRKMKCCCVGHCMVSCKTSRTFVRARIVLYVVSAPYLDLQYLTYCC